VYVDHLVDAWGLHAYHDYNYFGGLLPGSVLIVPTIIFRVDVINTLTMIMTGIITGVPPVRFF
jgi:hypothetical protein